MKDQKIKSERFVKDNAGAGLVGCPGLFDPTELHLPSEDPPSHAGVQVPLKSYEK